MPMVWLVAMGNELEHDMEYDMGIGELIMGSDYVIASCFKIQVLNSVKICTPGYTIIGMKLMHKFFLHLFILPESDF